jgi:hypothetical protein
MASLFDGISKIKKIHILGIYRQNENYLSFLIKRFNEWESYYKDVSFQYYFLENNSTDKTREILNEFIKTRKHSKLLMYNMKTDYMNIDDGRNYNRISTLAKLRNMLVDEITPLPENEWCLFIDSNIYFQDDTLTRIFNEVQPTDQNIAMMSVYTQQLILPKIHSDKIKEPVLMNHYYDTYSIIDINRKSFFPKCPFEKCTICTNYHINNEKIKHIPRIGTRENVVEVSCCFGGFVLIKTDALNHPKIRWDTVCFDLDNDKSLCEHLLFCDRLKSITNQKIVILQNIDRIYRTV